MLNSVFLHHCVQAGLDLAIVNPAHITPYAEIAAEQRELAEDLIYNRRDDALPRFIDVIREASTCSREEDEPNADADLPSSERIHWTDPASQEGRHRRRCSTSRARVRRIAFTRGRAS